MNSVPLFSAHWHHVRDVRARLADDVMVTRHVYRNRVSWLLHRPATNTFHRLDTQSFELVDRLDGSISVGEVWEQALQQRDHAAPTQDVWMHLLADLNEADLLVVDTRIPVEMLFERRRSKRSREHRERYLNPLYMRFALFDPDALLDRLLPLAQAMFSRVSFFLWLALMAVSALVLFVNSERLLSDVMNAASLSPDMAVLFLFVYPPLKLLHELGHALAIKRCGGYVRETGIALMVMLPLPYVDARSCAVFKAKTDRMLVSAAGILVELGVAACGALLWAGSDGFASELGLVLLITGALSTLFINGNPLLKFDGYYLLADWLEIPNLQARSRRETGRWLRRGLSGKWDEQAVSEDVRETLWLVLYGIGSGIYRTVLMLTIAWMVSERWFLFGLALALFALFQALVRPLWRGVRALFQDSQLKGWRAKALALGIPSLFVVVLTLLPLPHASVTRGVVWLADNAVIRAASVCQVSEVMVEPGSRVLAGDVLFQCADADLESKQQYLSAQVAELNAITAGVARSDRVEYARRLPELAVAKERLADVQRRIAAEQHRANVDGRFFITGTSALAGRAFSRGEVVAYTVPDNGRTIRLAFPERQIADIDAHIARIEVMVRQAGQMSGVYTTSILHRSPAASLDVPSAALTDLGGGPHAADPASDGLQLLQSVVDIELAWPEAVAPAPIGEHVVVRFVHSPQPLAGRLINTVRRAFMDRQPV